MAKSELPDFIKLDFPPGIVRGGTVYDAMGRWYDMNAVRWHNGPDNKPVLQPEGGWSVLSGAGASAVGAVVRGMHAWRRNAGVGFVAFGTRLKLYVYSAGTLSDVTPTGGSALVTGDNDASGTYFARTESHTWQLDNYGEDLVACSYSDGRILMWDSSVGVGTKAAAVTNAPTSCKGVVVTPEHFLVALGASGNGRNVAWADQDDITDWTASNTNQAGDQDLPGAGLILAGRRGARETLIWTETDLWSMRFIGGDLVYGFQIIGAKCGPVSRRAMTVVGTGQAFWMGHNSFWEYDGGATRKIPCEIGDYIFSSINRAQISKVCCWARSDFNEIIWTYPDSGSNEVNHRVVYNRILNWWGHSTYVRSDGIDRDFLEYPLEAGPGGSVYECEKGTTYADEGGSPSYTPYVESGPFEIGSGGRIMHITGFVPDEATQGAANVSLYTRLYPNGSETTNGPYTLANPTSVRLSARQVRMRVSQVTGGWRWGTPRLDITPGGRR